MEGRSWNGHGICLSKLLRRFVEPLFSMVSLIEFFWVVSDLYLQGLCSRYICLSALALPLLQVPAEDAKPLYLQYAKLEEEHGLDRHAMAIYDRATKAVTDQEKLSIYEIYIARAAEFLGVPKTRAIYEVCRFLTKLCVPLFAYIL
jgi:hypothetical protein